MRKTKVSDNYHLFSMSIISISSGLIFGLRFRLTKFCRGEKTNDMHVIQSIQILCERIARKSCQIVYYLNFFGSASGSKLRPKSYMCFVYFF